MGCEAVVGVGVGYGYPGGWGGCVVARTPAAGTAGRSTRSVVAFLSTRAFAAAVASRPGRLRIDDPLRLHVESAGGRAPELPGPEGRGPRHERQHGDALQCRGAAGERAEGARRRGIPAYDLIPRVRPGTRTGPRPSSTRPASQGGRAARRGRAARHRDPRAATGASLPTDRSGESGTTVTAGTPSTTGPASHTDTIVRGRDDGLRPRGGQAGLGRPEREHQYLGTSRP